LDSGDILRALVIIAFIALLGFGCLGIAEERTYPSVASKPSALIAPGADSYSEQYVTKQGYISLKVPEGSLQAKYDELRERLKDEGAILSDVNYNEYDDRKQYSFSIKIMPVKFDSVMGAIQDYGEVKDISVQLEDVTQQYVELDLKIKNREAELERLQKLYNQSDNVSDLIEVERELTRVETELEILKQQKQYIVSRVELSTITVNIYEDKPAVSKLTLSLETLGVLFFGAIAAAITLLVLAAGFLLPIAVVLVALYLAYKKLFGQRKGGPKAPEHKKIPVPE
jgi:hypothetical protein